MESLTLAAIREQYPNQWVLLGDPEMTDPLLQTSLSHKLKSGTVLLHSTNRFEIAQQSATARIGYETITLFYTGILPQNRKIWL